MDFADTLAGRPYRLPGLGFLVQRLELTGLVVALERGQVVTGLFEALAQEAGGDAGHRRAVHRVDHLLHRAKAGDDDGDPMLDAQCEVGL
ncbi:hypothetical protein WR25_24989 [Diploscapter pachys]|uniref:Uncharacterized protein n=1 Tax=Diploscapter pachys TaxID=2018661 RepID=A0A2A2KD54_9BILA|nr:hypothetical protein WR25_24989 [Diploscapter pachys]